jgi:hypothetical protein
MASRTSTKAASPCRAPTPIPGTRHATAGDGGGGEEVGGRRGVPFDRVSSRRDVPLTPRTSKSRPSSETCTAPPNWRIMVVVMAI